MVTKNLQIDQHGVSVLVCCYNSSENLPATIKHLALQEVSSGIPWEIIVIDNASTDSTAAVALKEWKKYGLTTVDFRLLSQPVPGKNYAFDMGLKAAKYEFILTCDDDNWLSPDYIEKSFQIMSADPEIGALGGCALFEPEQPVNSEITDFTYYFVNGPQTWAERDHWVYGAGSLYRKSILTGLLDKGWKQITSGRKGKSLICGEDSEICFMIYLKGFKIIANDQLTFRHYVPLKRQKITYITRLSFWMGYSHVLMNSYYPIMNYDQRPINHIINHWLWGATKTFMKSLVLFMIRKVMFWKKTTVKQQLKFNGIRGTWWGLVMNRKKVIRHHQQTRALLTNQ